MTDLSRPHFRAVYESPGPLGAYTLDVFTDAPPAEPLPFSIDGAPRPACGEREREFGGGLSAWSLEASLVDADDVRAVLSEPDSLVHVSGPNGRGGTFTVWTKALESGRSASPSPQVYPGSSVSVEAHDGIAALKDLTATRYDIDLNAAEEAAVGVWQALPGSFPTVAGPFAVWSSWPLRPDGDATLAGAGAVIDWGRTFDTPYDRIRALCELGQLSIYQPSDAPPDAPRWEVVPRYAVGLPETVLQITHQVDGDLQGGSGTLPDRRVTLPSFTAVREGADNVPALRRVVLLYPGGRTIPYAGPSVLTGATARVRVGPIDGGAGVHAEIDFNVANVNGNATVALEVETPTGTVSAPSALVGVDESDERYTFTYRTTGDVPSGVLFATLGAGDFDEDFGAAAARLTDEDGGALERFEGEVSLSGTGTAEITPARDVRGSGGAAASWRSMATGLDYPTPSAASAAARASQQAAPLAVMEIELTGLWGPEPRFLLPAGPRSPFLVDVELFVVGCAPDLERGTTPAVVVAVEVRAVGTTVSSPSARTLPLATS